MLYVGGDAGWEKYVSGTSGTSGAQGTSGETGTGGSSGSGGTSGSSGTSGGTGSSGVLTAFTLVPELPDEPDVNIFHSTKIRVSELPHLSLKLIKTLF